jgi:hypothetical protein
MKNTMLISLMFLASACATRTVKVVDATWVSMKNSMPPGSHDKLTKVADLSEEYCLDSWTGDYGLMDEVVKKTEANYNIDYIKYPAFTKSVGKSCVQLSGEGYRITR